MTASLCQAAIAGLPPGNWQAAATGISLRPTKDKLERPCRIFRRNRRAAAAVKFTVAEPARIRMDGHDPASAGQCLATRSASRPAGGSRQEPNLTAGSDLGAT